MIHILLTYKYTKAKRVYTWKRLKNTRWKISSRPLQKDPVGGRSQAEWKHDWYPDPFLMRISAVSICVQCEVVQHGHTTGPSGSQQGKTSLPIAHSLRWLEVALCASDMSLSSVGPDEGPFFFITLSLTLCHFLLFLSLFSRAGWPGCEHASPRCAVELMSSKLKRLTKMFCRQIR